MNTDNIETIVIDQNLNQPLLNNQEDPQLIKKVKVNVDEQNLEKTNPKNELKIFEMFLNISQSSGTYVISSLSFYLIQTVTLIFLGHDSNNDPNTNILYINATQIGTVFINIFGLNFCIGAMHAFDTLGAQAWARKEFELLYDIYQEARIFSMLIFLIFMLPICFSSQYFLYLFRFDEQIIIITSYFIKILLISVTLNLFLLINGKLLEIIGHELIVMGINIVTLIIHIIICLFLITSFGFGLNGAAFAFVISSMFNLCCTSFFIYILNPFPGIHKNILQIETESLSTSKFYIYSKMAITNGLLHLMHQISFDVIVFASYYLGQISLTTNGILLNYIQMIFHILLGFSVPITKAIHQNLGRKINLTKTYNFIMGIFIIVFIIAMVISIFNYYFKFWIAWAYIDNIDVINNFAPLINIYSFMIFFDWAKQIINFILYGMNKHFVVNVISCLSHLFIFIPLGLLLTFTFKFGYVGLWYGSFLHMIVFTFIQIIYIKYLNIEKNAKKILNKIQNLIEDEDIFFK